LDMVHNSRIKDISPLKELAELDTFEAYLPNVSDISPLKGLINLKTIVLSTKNTEDYSILYELYNLEDASINDASFSGKYLIKLDIENTINIITEAFKNSKDHIIIEKIKSIEEKYKDDDKKKHISAFLLFIIKKLLAIDKERAIKLSTNIIKSTENITDYFIENFIIFTEKSSSIYNNMKDILYNNDTPLFLKSTAIKFINVYNKNESIDIFDDTYSSSHSQEIKELTQELRFIKRYEILCKKESVKIISKNNIYDFYKYQNIELPELPSIYLKQDNSLITDKLIKYILYFFLCDSSIELYAYKKLFKTILSNKNMNEFADNIYKELYNSYPKGALSFAVAFMVKYPLFHYVLI